MRRFAAMVILTLAAVPTLAQAQDSGTPEERRACRGDFVKYCRHLPDEQKIEIAQCLASHRPRISSACDSVLRSHGF